MSENLVLGHLATAAWDRPDPGHEGTIEVTHQWTIVNLVTADAEPRNIKNRDRVKVFNDRGAISIPAKVTNRIMPGVVCVYQGAWYNPDEFGVDQGGCANVLTRGEHSPGGAFCGNTTLVQVEKT